MPKIKTVLKSIHDEVIKVTLASDQNDYEKMLEHLYSLHGYVVALLILSFKAMIKGKH